jgi:pilus assembly protein Flp/PilA
MDIEMLKPVEKAATSRFMHDEGGATAIEYAMIAAGVSVAILTGVATLGQKVMDVFYTGLSNLF